jgi:chitinase
MIAIGGSAQSTRFGQMAQKDADRITFVNSVVEFLKEYNFDGVMIDWQYPQQNDSDNYVKLLGELHEKLASTSLILGIGGPALKKDGKFNDGFNISKIIRFS